VFTVNFLPRRRLSIVMASSRFVRCGRMSQLDVEMLYWYSYLCM